MKIGNSEQTTALKENEDLYKRLNKTITKKISSKEEEIKQIKNLYDLKTEEAKINGEKKFAESIDQNQQNIINESKQAEEKIQAYRDRLQKFRDTMNQEELNLKSNNARSLDNLKERFEDNFQNKYLTISEDQKQIQNTLENSLKENAIRSKSEIANIENASHFKINSISNDLNNKSINIEKELQDQINHNLKEHKRELDLQKGELKKEAAADIEKSKHLLDEKKRINDDELSFQEKHQKETLNQRNLDFKTRYDNLVAEHNAIINRLATKLNSDVKKIEEKQSLNKKLVQERVEDPFYRVEKLRTSMVEDHTGVTISLPIADYEKDFVHLSAQGRNIKITLSRQYSNKLQAEDGSTNKSSRNELYSKELNSVNILNPKEITQNYNDGILTFKVKRA